MMRPSVEVIIKIADALEVSIDYLVGKTSMVLDKQTLSCLEEISKLTEDARQYILNHLNIMIRDFKTKKAYAK